MIYKGLSGVLSGMRIEIGFNWEDGKGMEGEG